MLLFNVLSAIAEFERDMIRERTAAGTEARECASKVPCRHVQHAWGVMPLQADPPSANGGSQGNDQALDSLLYFHNIGTIEVLPVISALTALAQESRLDAFRLLVRAGPDGLSAGAIAEELELPSATLSFHLKELKNASLALCEREGRSLIYCANCATVEGILENLTRNYCRGVAGKNTRRSPQRAQHRGQGS